jgi:hypothetical protein
MASIRAGSMRGSRTTRWSHIAQGSLLIDIMRSGQQALNSTAETALVAARDPAEEVAVLVTSLTGTHGKNLMLTRVTDGELRSLDRASGAP